MNGLQDAGTAFDKMSGQVAKKMGCRLGTFTHCVLSRGNLLAQCFGDDCRLLCTRREVRARREDLLKSRGVLGPLLVHVYANNLVSTS